MDINQIELGIAILLGLAILIVVPWSYFRLLTPRGALGGFVMLFLAMAAMVGLSILYPATLKEIMQRSLDGVAATPVSHLGSLARIGLLATFAFLPLLYFSSKSNIESRIPKYSIVLLVFVVMSSSAISSYFMYETVLGETGASFQPESFLLVWANFFEAQCVLLGLVTLTYIFGPILSVVSAATFVEKFNLADVPNFDHAWIFKALSVLGIVQEPLQVFSLVVVSIFGLHTLFSKPLESWLGL